jgi:hypothetical protein
MDLVILFNTTGVEGTSNYKPNFNARFFERNVIAKFGSHQHFVNYGRCSLSKQQLAERKLSAMEDTNSGYGQILLRILSDR